MRVEVLHKDGRLAVTDTANLTAAQPFGGACLAAELVLRMDKLEEEGICLEVHHHDAAQPRDPGETPFAGRYRGCRVCVAEAEELPGIESVAVDGRVVAWSQGGALVDGLRFEHALRLWYSGPPYACDNYKACRLYEYLEAARPEIADDPPSICALFGYPVEAFVEARLDEEAQADDEEGGDAE